MTKVDFQKKEFNGLTLKELYDILTLRQTVFVVEQNCPYLDNDGYDLFATHLMGKNEAQDILCYVRILPPGKKYDNEVAITRVVNRPDCRKMGLGRAIMEEAIRIIREAYENNPIRISAQTYLIKFYESFGFVKEGGTYLEDGIPHIEMVLK